MRIFEAARHGEIMITTLTILACALAALGWYCRVRERRPVEMWRRGYRRDRERRWRGRM